MMTSTMGVGLAVGLFLSTTYDVTVAHAAPKRPKFASPVIMPNGQVTFRVYAPAAKHVEIRADWLPGKENARLCKNAPMARGTASSGH